MKDSNDRTDHAQDAPTTSEHTNTSIYWASEDDLLNLYDYLCDALGQSSCDNSLLHTRAWARRAGIEGEAFIRWSEELGCYCDCEVLLNVCLSSDAPDEGAGDECSAPSRCDCGLHIELEDLENLHAFYADHTSTDVHGSRVFETVAQVERILILHGRFPHLDEYGIHALDRDDPVFGRVDVCKDCLETFFEPS